MYTPYTPFYVVKLGCNFHIFDPKHKLWVQSVFRTKILNHIKQISAENFHFCKENNYSVLHGCVFREDNKADVVLSEP